MYCITDFLYPWCNSVFIIIADPAGIPNKPSQTYTDGDSTLKLFCVVDANPPIADQAVNKWTRLDYDMSRTTTTLESGSDNLRTLVLTISNVIREDIGIFTCEAQNTLGSIATKDYTVDPVACEFSFLWRKHSLFNRDSFTSGTIEVI